MSRDNLILCYGGTKAGLDALTGDDRLRTRELGITTDTKELFTGDGTSHYLVGPVIVDTAAKRAVTEPLKKRFYFEMDTKRLYVGDGAAWTEITRDLTPKMDKITTPVAHNLIKMDENGNAADAGVRVNDASDTVLDIWTAPKIKATVDAAISGLSWRDPVDYNNVDPVNLAVVESGTRVLITGTGAGAFLNKDNHIATRNASNTDWVFTAPVANWAVFVKDTETGFVFDADGSVWQQFTGTGQVVDGKGLRKTGNTLDVVPAEISGFGIEGDVSGNFRVASEIVGNGLTGGSGSAIEVVAEASQGLRVSSNGVAVDYDDQTITIGSGNRLSIKDGGVDEHAISSAIAGSGLTGGSGVPLALLPDSITGGNVANVVKSSANGVGVGIDAVSILQNAEGQLRVGTVDGGSFGA